MPGRYVFGSNDIRGRIEDLSKDIVLVSKNGLFRSAGDVLVEVACRNIAL